MPVTHSNAARDAINDALDAVINAGSANASGQLVLLDGATDIVVFDLANPAFGASSAGTLTLDVGGSGIDANAIATGEVDSAEIRDRDEDPHIFCSVGGVGSGADIEVSNVSIATAQDCTLESLSYTAAP